MSERNAQALLQTKIQTARRILSDTGWSGVAKTTTKKLVRPLQKWIHRQSQENFLLGRLVELRGNTGVIEGCRFDLSHPAIATRLKVRFLTGNYERNERALLTDLDLALPVVELGGSIGVVACITNKRLKHPKQHVVIEASPELTPILVHNRALNHAEFSVLNRAVAYGSDEVDFYLHWKFVGGSVQRATDRRVRVPTTTLAQILIDYGFDRCTLICDIEGAEVALVEHESGVLSEKVEWFMISTHDFITGAEAVARTITRLQEIGFTVVKSIGGDYVLRNDRSKGTELSATTGL